MKLRFLKKKIFTLILLFLILVMSYHIIQNNNEVPNEFYHKNEISDYKVEYPETTSIWGLVNLTDDSEINETRHYHNETIPIDGELLDGDLLGIPGYTMVIIIDGQAYSEFNDTTDANGVFKINLIIPYSLNIYSSHKIEANVTSPAGTVEFLNHYTIDVNTTSYFDIDDHNRNIPQYASGYYKVPGFLNYDNHTGIPYQTINSIWLNESSKTFIPPNAPINTNSDGSFKYISITDDNASKRYYLNLTYSGNIPYINGSQKTIPINIFRNITCVWNTVGSATEGNTITIIGQLFARNNSNLKINFTEVGLEFINGPSIGNTSTNENGTFFHNYQIPLGFVGNYIIGVGLLNFSSVYSNTTHIISIASAPISPITPAEDIGGVDEDTPPPFQNFFIIFIPIIIGIAAALVAFIIFRLRKQKEEAQIVKLPLEDRIRNLKILKDTGRLEEALSYLFQSIYIELINAKYGRRKKENETIRDFAIISVRELKLNPASIYPFIQNIEKIIYDKPFIIKDKDFYASVELFSPIYFELTGYQFILNF